MPCNKLIEKRIKLRWRQPLDKLPRWPHFSTSAGRSIDHLRAGYMITEHLLKLGCRRIAFVAYSNSASTVAARIAGYTEALFVSGAPVEPTLVQRLDSDDESEVRRVMESVKPDAIIGANDRTAGHLMHSLMRLNYTITLIKRTTTLFLAMYLRTTMCSTTIRRSGQKTATTPNT